MNRTFLSSSALLKGEKPWEVAMLPKGIRSESGMAGKPYGVQGEWYACSECVLAQCLRIPRLRFRATEILDRSAQRYRIRLITRRKGPKKRKNDIHSSRLHMKKGTRVLLKIS